MKAWLSASACCLALLCCSPLRAQMQIGGGICSSASLSGNYSLTLTGRDVSSSVTFTKISQGVGTATFDGLNKVTFALTTNTNAGTTGPQTLGGTYSLQANCVGVVNISSGDTATFTLAVFNNPTGTGTASRNFLLAGNDGVYSFTGNGGLLPAAPCSTSQLSGVFAFNATSFSLTSGSVSAVGNISGLLNFDGQSGITSTWYLSTGATTTDTTSGQYAVTQGCTATASVTDASGQTFTLAFTLTSATGANFLVSGASPSLMFTGSGRVL